MRTLALAAVAALTIAAGSVATVAPAAAAYNAACVKAARDDYNAVVMPAMQAAIAGSITWAEYMDIYWQASAEYRSALGDCW